VDGAQDFRLVHGFGEVGTRVRGGGTQGFRVGTRLRRIDIGGAESVWGLPILLTSFPGLFNRGAELFNTLGWAVYHPWLGWCTGFGWMVHRISGWYTASGKSVHGFEWVVHRVSELVHGFAGSI